MIIDYINKNIISINSNDSFKTASRIMGENNIGFLPVTENNEFIGVITDRDICINLININNVDSEIKSFITKNIISVDSNSKVKDALLIMKKNKVKRLLVKENDKYIGITSISDLLKSNNPEIINTIKSIFSIHDNKNHKDAKIDEFYL